MVSKHNEDAQSCAQQGELLKQQRRLVGGEIDEIPGDCDEIGVDRAHGVDGLREPLRAEKVAEVDVGDVRDAQAVEVARPVCAGKGAFLNFDALRNMARLQRTAHQRVGKSREDGVSHRRRVIRQFSSRLRLGHTRSASFRR